MTISASIMNPGSESKEYPVDLIINGVTVATKIVEIGPGATETVRWQTTEESEAGTYDVVIGDKTGSFRIVEDSDINISLYIDSSTKKKGEPITISGYVSPVSENSKVRIFVRYSMGDWLVLDDVDVEPDGYYSYSWEPMTAGSYEVVASLLDAGGSERVPSYTQNVLVEEARGGIPGFSSISILSGTIVAIFLIYFINNTSDFSSSNMSKIKIINLFSRLKRPSYYSDP